MLWVEGGGRGGRERLALLVLGSEGREPDGRGSCATPARFPHPSGPGAPGSERELFASVGPMLETCRGSRGGRGGALSSRQKVCVSASMYRGM